MLDQLSKLLAQENVTLVRGSFHTASFDLVERVVRIPIFNGMSEIEELLMTFHEIGHALETTQEYIAAIKKRGGQFGDILNICEDVRIEKKVKTRYPGSRSVFYHGYKELAQKKFFGNLKGTFGFVDRINLHAKVGHVQEFFFDEEEQKLVDLIESATNQEETILAAEAVASFLNTKKQKKEEEAKAEIKKPGKPAGDGSNPTNGDDSDSKESGNHPGAGAGESEEIKTISKFQQELSHFISKENVVFLDHGVSSSVKFLPFVSSYNKIHDKFANNEPEVTKLRERVRRAAGFLNKQFMMKKAATSHKKNLESKSGRLDGAKLYAYKTSKDLFQKYQVKFDEKNHGMVILLDASGSMSSTINDCLEEIYVLISFCDMASIPFRVVAYTTQSYETTDALYQNKEFFIRKPTVNWNPLQGDPLLLVELANSKSTFRQNETVIQHLCITPSMRYFFQLGSTPTAEACVVLREYTKNFQREERNEKTTCVVITDGGPNSSIQRSNSKNIYRGENGKTYEISNTVDYIETVLTELKLNIQGSTVLGFFLMEREINAAAKSVIKTLYPKSVVISSGDASFSEFSNPGYDSLMAIRAKSRNVSSGDAITDLLSKDIGNKKFLTAIIDRMA